MESPQLEMNPPSSFILEVADSPECFDRMDSKKRCLHPQTLEVENASKRVRYGKPLSGAGFSLDTESIFDAQGLISFPTSSDGVTGGFVPTNPPQEPSLFEALKQQQQRQVDASSLFSGSESSGSIQDSPSPASPFSTLSDSSPTSPTEEKDSMLQLTLAGMISCLRRISDIAVVNPQLGQDSNLYFQVVSANSVIANLVQHVASTNNTSSPGCPSSPFDLPAVSSPAPLQAPVQPLRLSLKSVETLWYAERPFPTMECELVDPQTSQRAVYINNCRVQVSLLDGHGNPCDKLTGPAAAFDFIFPVSNGVVELSGLRFGAVSSKHGGHFQIQVSVLPALGIESVAPIISPRIQVLSYRLFHAPKVDFSKLKPSDPLTKVKGIGSLYAKRFAAIGVSTVGQLATLEVDTLHNASDASKKLLECLRKDRGALTLSKLNEYIAQAREIVKRATPNQDGILGTGLICL